MDYRRNNKGWVCYLCKQIAFLCQMSKYIHGVSRGSAIEHVLCHRKYYNGSATENTDLDIFCDTCLQWEFHYSIFKAPALECIFYNTWSSDIFLGTSSAQFQQIKTTSVFTPY